MKTKLIQNGHSFLTVVNEILNLNQNYFMFFIILFTFSAWVSHPLSSLFFFPNQKPITIFMIFVLLPLPISSGPLTTHSIKPNFTASNFQFIDHSGSFLVSFNSTFKASIFNPYEQFPNNYYFIITHFSSNTIIWSANREKPISKSSKLLLTVDGISLTNESNDVVWSTPKLSSEVSSLQLLETGNLVLLDGQNVSVWESFDHPTDTIVLGQQLGLGKKLEGSVSESDMSSGVYGLVITDGDLVLQWKGMTYWKLSMDPKAFRDSNYLVSFMAVNGTGLYLFADDGLTTVMQVIFDGLGSFDFRIAKIEYNGMFTVSSFIRNNWVQDFHAPVEHCQVPFVCGRLGLCTSGSMTGTCACPPGFNGEAKLNGECRPIEKSISLPSVCNSSVDHASEEVNSSVSYLRLGKGMDYFANNFVVPVRYGIDLSVCENLCTKNCPCLAIFHENSSGSCYLIENDMGSIMMSSSSKNGRLGYLKTLVMSSSPQNSDKNGGFPLVGLVLIPCSVFFVIVIVVVLAILWVRRNRLYRSASVKLKRWDSSSSVELEEIHIPGLPVRFRYEELAAATENFKAQIGSGGFGIVYKGTLPDRTLVAVKKITTFGVQGKKEFCTEIAVIGNIHHINLVRLKGFCARGRLRFLVYEYMNRGSLDRALFGKSLVLEWKERFDIALGTARGLAYLHSECDQKIIHCDVKPENILLHDNSQVKIADFGLSKLLSPEQSFLFTTMRGTRGYLAPEWLTSSAISDKADVYSYGMVLLEIVRGRKNCALPMQSGSLQNDSSEQNAAGSSSSSGVELPIPEPTYFPLLALEMHEQKRHLELADPRLEGRVSSEEVKKLVQIALCCVHEEAALRPSMTNVVGMLEGGLPLGEPRIRSLNFLRFYGRRFFEASTTEGREGQSELLMFPRVNTITSSHNPLSYISSQQLSGPR